MFVRLKFAVPVFAVPMFAELAVLPSIGYEFWPLERNQNVLKNYPPNITINIKANDMILLTFFACTKCFCVEEVFDGQMFSTILKIYVLIE